MAGKEQSIIYRRGELDDSMMRSGFGALVQEGRQTKREGFVPYAPSGRLARLATPVKEEPKIDLEEIENRRRERIERETYQRAFAAAEKAGLEAGQQRIEERLSAILPPLDGMLRALDGLPLQIFAAAEHQLVETAIRLVRQLLQHELSVESDTAFGERVKQLLIQAGDRDEVVVVVAPQQAEMLARLPVFEKLTIRADEMVAPGSVRIETDFGGIEDGIEKQLIAMEEALREHFAERVEKNQAAIQAHQERTEAEVVEGRQQAAAQADPAVADVIQGMAGEIVSQETGEPPPDAPPGPMETNTSPSSDGEEAVPTVGIATGGDVTPDMLSAAGSGLAAEDLTDVEQVNRVIAAQAEEGLDQDIPYEAQADSSTPHASGLAPELSVESAAAVAAGSGQAPADSAETAQADSPAEGDLPQEDSVATAPAPSDEMAADLSEAPVASDMTEAPVEPEASVEPEALADPDALETAGTSLAPEEAAAFQEVLSSQSTMDEAEDSASAPAQSTDDPAASEDMPQEEMEFADADASDLADELADGLAEMAISDDDLIAMDEEGADDDFGIPLDELDAMDAAALEETLALDVDQPDEVITHDPTGMTVAEALKSVEEQEARAALEAEAAQGAESATESEVSAGEEGVDTYYQQRTAEREVQSVDESGAVAEESEVTEALEVESAESAAVVEESAGPDMDEIGSVK